MATAAKKGTEKPKNEAAKNEPKQEQKPKAPAVEAKPVAAAGAPVAVQTQDNGEGKKLPKNHTESSLNPTAPESALTWLADFKKQCKDHPPRKGYDQHWNNLGFIHDGPAVRLGNQGAARMMVLLGDIFAQRILAGDAEAETYLDLCIDFCEQRRDTLKKEKDDAILAEATRIMGKKPA